MSAGRERGWALAVAWVLAIGAVFVWASTLPPDPLYRGWRVGAVIPGRMTIEPWRWLMGPLLHLRPEHLLGNALCLLVLGRAATLSIGGAWAGVASATAAVVGAAVSLTLDPAWLLGASGAVFGLLGVCMGAALRRPPREAGPRGVMLGLTVLGCAWIWLAPDDRAAHLAGALAGSLFGLLAAAPARAGSGRAPRLARLLGGAVVVGVLAAGGFALRFDGAPTGWRSVSTGAQPMTVPDDWTPGGALAPCAATWTDGVLTACMLPASWSPAELGRQLEAAGHRPEATAAEGLLTRWTASPGGQGTLTLWRRQGGAILLVHAASATCADARAAHVTQLRDQNLKL